MSNFTCMYFEKAMPTAFCDYVRASLDWSAAVDAGVHEEEGRDYTNYRKTQVLSEDLMSPIGAVCRTYLLEGNARGQWAKTVCGFDPVQILRYGQDGHYWWHHDKLPPQDGKQRQVSLILLLSDPSEFEGGELQIKDKTDNALKNKGDIIVFDSAARHRVTPVTKGTRISAVCWAYGYYEE